MNTILNLGFKKIILLILIFVLSACIKPADNNVNINEVSFISNPFVKNKITYWNAELSAIDQCTALTKTTEVWEVNQIKTTKTICALKSIDTYKAKFGYWEIQAEIKNNAWVNIVYTACGNGYELKGEKCEEKKIVTSKEEAKCENNEQGYHKKNDKIVYCGSDFPVVLVAWEIKGVDISSFQILSDFYAKDKNNAYSGANIIFGADPNSFIVLSEEYTKDKNNVYINYSLENRSVKKVRQADVASFTVLSYGYAKDKNNVYIHGEIFDENFEIGGVKIGGIKPNPNTFEILDPESFQSRGGGYLKDDKNVYFKNEMIDNADSNTFKTISSIHGIAKDKNNVFIGGIIINGADSITFKICDSQFPDYGCDKNNAYFFTGVIGYYREEMTEKPYLLIPNVDILSFQPLGLNYAKDKNKVYNCTSKNIEVLEKVDPATFQPKSY